MCRSTASCPRKWYRYKYAYFAPDGGDLSWDFINREAVTGGAPGTSNVALSASNLTALKLIHQI